MGRPGRNRNADSEELAARELESRFPAERWRKLRTILGEAFSQRIEDADWSTADWVQRLIAAAGAGEDRRDEQRQRYAADIRQVLLRARENTQTGTELVEDGYEAAVVQAEIVARRVARRIAATIGLTFTGVAAILAFGAVVLGK